jgi:hypothetical protein
MDVEQRLHAADLEVAPIAVDLRGHQPAIGRHEEQFLAVAPPARLKPAATDTSHFAPDFGNGVT